MDPSQVEDTDPLLLWLGRAEHGAWPSPDELLMHVEQSDRPALLERARDLLSQLPAPIHPRVSTPLARRRRALAFLLATTDDAHDSRRLSEIAREIWLSGAGDAAYVRALLAMGERGLAQSIARLLLGDELFEDDPELAAALRESLRLPPGFEEAAHELAAAPSEEGWRALMRFGDDEGGRRPEHALTILERAGVDAETRFLLASLEGPASFVGDLVRTGEIEPRQVEAQARAAEGDARGPWLSMAAEAAATRGDAMTTARLCRELEHILGAAEWELLLERLRMMATDAVRSTLEDLGLVDEDDDAS